MPARELQDFVTYWNLSMFNPPGSDNLRIPGGVPGEGGVDYNEYLIPWCKGNSVSVDQTTLKHPRDLISMLVENYRSDIYRVDSNMKKRLDYHSGVTFDNLVAMFGEPIAKGRRIGKISKDWIRIEQILGQMLIFGDIAIFSDEGRTLNRAQNRISENIRNRGYIAETREDMNNGIVGALEATRNQSGHIRLSRKKGWELYIRDHYGTPSGIDGHIPGNMAGNAPPDRRKTMAHPLHLVYAETIARAMSRDGAVWGKNQTIIREQISDAVIDGNGHSLPLDDFYLIHSRNAAAHMADHTFQRSIADLASAEYKLEEVPNSNPKAWVVKLDPDMVRWRMNRRDRDRGRDGQ